MAGEEKPSGPAPNSASEKPKTKVEPAPQTAQKVESKTASKVKGPQEPSDLTKKDPKTPPTDGPKGPGADSAGAKPAGGPAAGGNGTGGPPKTAPQTQPASGLNGPGGDPAGGKPPSGPAAGGGDTCYNKECSKTGPGKYGGKPCCAGHECTPAPWEGHSAHRCFPTAPKCYNSNDRCAGAPGKPFVPYANWYVLFLGEYAELFC